MAKSPAWIAALIDELTPSGQPALWIGPGPLPAVQAQLSGLPPDAVPESGAYSAVFVAACVEQDLRAHLRALRAVCVPGALLCLLLPEELPGVGARVARVFDPLGRVGRRPRPMSELCGALLGAGASRLCVRRLEGQLRCVTGWLPEVPFALDAAFDTRVQATS